MITLLLLQLLWPAYTPGSVRPLTKLQICTIQWGRDSRHVTLKMKREVAGHYGLTLEQLRVCCETDHLIPRELGGADEVRNLWAQPWPQARIKDKEENRLHKAVCAGEMTLIEAQDRMRGWGGEGP